MHDDSSRFRYSTGYVFMQSFRLTFLTFRVTFTPLTSAWSKIFSQSQFQAAELNWRQFKTKSQMKSASKLVPFFLLEILIVVYDYLLCGYLKPTIELLSPI